MSNINRFKIGDFEKTKKFLAGKLNKSAAPKYAQAFQSELSVSAKGKVLYRGKPLLSPQEADEYMRNSVYTKGKIVSTTRDGGYSQLSKEVYGIPRRMWDKFLKSQAHLRATDPATKTFKKPGKKEFDLRSFQSDLLELKSSQLTKELK